MEIRKIGLAPFPVDVPREAMNLSLGMVRGRGVVRSVLSEPEFSTLSRILEGTQMKLGSSGGPEGRKAAAADLSGCVSAGASPLAQSVSVSRGSLTVAPQARDLG